MVVNLIIYTTICLLLRGAILLDPCELKAKCRECIRDPHLCKWCSVDDYKGSRCIRKNDSFVGCEISYIENPITEDKVIKNLDFHSGGNNVIQIRPQEVNIKLRVGESKDFQFSFMGARDYPADLYFLIDASASMKPVKDATAEASEKIYSEMKKNTKNVYLGMGTFVDKNALPFVRKLNNDSYTYSFRNQFKLKDDYQNFSKIVRNTGFGGNFDRAEGGFDALAQVITCNKEIGWRAQSRKIVLFITNMLSHTAGDGKWAGITQPYDGQCYTKDGFYLKERELDYPSISILNKLASDNEVTIIFIINTEFLDDYRYQCQYIRGSKYVGFTTTSDNKIEFNKSELDTVLSNIYKEISKNVELKVYMTPEDRNHIEVSFNPDCKKGSNKENKVECKVASEEEKQFTGTIKLSQYYGKPRTRIDVAVAGINERLTLNIEIIKDCDCEVNNSKIISDAEYCSSNGDKKCGICDCKSDRYGDKCSCTATNSTGGGGNETGCFSKRGGEMCSGRGSCFCDSCICQKGFHGRYCQCNKNSCPSKCNGRGECMCGKCINCEEGWTGNACECSTAPCAQKNGLICNGWGHCKCGSCACESKPAWDARLSHDADCVMLPCPDCHRNQCDKLKDCAICNSRESSDCTESCDRNIQVHVTKTLPLDNEPDVFTCDNVRVDIGCYTRFKYRYTGYGVEIFVETDKDCVESFYVFGGVFLASLLLVGLGTLVGWKLLTDARDRREYDRFIAQHADATDVGANPIYEPPKATYHNPTFRKRSVDIRL